MNVQQSVGADSSAIARCKNKNPQEVRGQVRSHGVLHAFRDSLLRHAPDGNPPMTLEELRRRLAAGNAPEAEIISVEGMVYVVRLDAEHMLTDGDAKSLRFPSAHAASKALGHLGLSNAWLVHHSPYDEMVGRADADLPRPGPLRTRMTFREL